VVDVYEIPAIRRPPGLGFIARPITQAPMQSRRQIHFPEIETRIPAVGRINYALAIRVPGWLQIKKRAFT
jgi:hypothetical protein